MEKQISFGILLLVLSVPCQSGVYKWVDENGQVHYGSQPPPTTQAKEIEIKQHKVDSESIERINRLTNQNKKVPNRTKSKTKNNHSSSVPKKRYKKLCEKYKKIYEGYKRDGVMGINPITGVKKKMAGESAKTALENAKDNVDIFCNN
ncbi:hypothetical protein CHH28_04140 [Bacterioplanes sanyensis]|uniref:DUF4124 domain-containing protein n=1 Tax=Bacterioplanes sanyensis TaxID=1249553 RepID=A0A222FHG2_9GAMM|nr:DUF4124 domain-containing protein [Bacterioplanes sanyensis]ASP37914.1 hypothetical protein CHH28_04140 [Bacterioplanes sanyensis]